MGKTKIIVYIVVLLIIIHLAGIEAKAFHAQISLNKVFMQYDDGYLGKIRLDLVDTQGFYLDMFQVGSYYQQIGKGLEFLAFKQPIGELWLLLGRDEYNLLQTNNSMVRVGLRADLQLSFGEISLSTDMMMDDITGVFLRYQVELHVPEGWLQGNVGLGNLLGSKDGYAFWVGFDL